MRGGVPVRLMISCAMPAAPALCVAQPDPASRAAPEASRAASTVSAPATLAPVARSGVVATLRAEVTPREPLQVEFRDGAVSLPVSR